MTYFSSLCLRLLFDDRGCSEVFKPWQCHLATEVLEKAESINDYSTWLASSTMTSGRHNGQREHQYTTHDMPHCRSMLGFMHETCPRLPLRLFAPNPPNSLHPGVSLSPFRGSASIHPGLAAPGTVHIAATSTQGVTVSVRMEPKESPTLT